MPSQNSVARLFASFRNSINKRNARRRSGKHQISIAAVDALESRQMLTAMLTSDVLGLQISGASDISEVTLANHFDDTAVDGTVVSIVTPSGTVFIEMYDQITPGTVQNFLTLTENNNYQDMFFHRLAEGFVLQGGGFQWLADAEQIDSVSNNGNIDNEFENWFDPELGGLDEGTPINVRGTLAMAKLGGDPDSATSQWFFNAADNSANLDNQNGGFTVFAHVLYDGMQTVDQLMQSTAVNAGGAFANLPVQNWEAGTELAREHLLLTTTAVVPELSYTVSVTDGQEYIDAAIVDGVLKITGKTAAESTADYATVLVEATDVGGNVVQESVRIAIGLPADSSVIGPIDVVTGNATLTWLDSDEATNYDIWISKMKDLAPSEVEVAGIVQQYGLEGTSHQVEQTLSKGIYQAWVRPQNSVGTGNWSNPFEFVVGLEEPAAAAIDSVTPDESNPNRVTVEWSAIDNATHYQVWLADSAGQVIYNTTTVETSFHTDADLTSNGVYNVWVRATNRRFNGAWSSAETFIANQNTNPVTITSPSIGSSIAADKRPVIEWDNPGSHDTFDVWVSQVGTSGAYIRQTTDTSSFQPDADLPEGVYQVWVRPPEFTGVAWSVPVTIGVGTKSEVTGPDASNNGSSSPTISWTSGIPNTTTELWVNGPSGRVIFETGLTGTSFDVTETLPDGAYTAWVRQAPPVGGYFAWSSAFRFEVGASTTPGTPTLSTSVDGSTITFSWASVTNGVKYELWVNSESTSQIITETELTGTSHQGTLTNPGTYRAWLRAFNSNGDAGPWSDEAVFVV